MRWQVGEFIRRPLIFLGDYKQISIEIQTLRLLKKQVTRGSMETRCQGCGCILVHAK